MPCLGSARLVFDLPAVPVWLSLRRFRSSPRSFHVSYSSSIATPTRWPPRCAYSIMAHLRGDFFEYTSGRWIFNDDLRHAERRRVFKVDELSRLAAESVNRSPDSDDIVRLEKLAEGGCNRTFLITMCCGFRMVAHIPYPATIPKYFTVASEVATTVLLRSIGLPIPEVYGYSLAPNSYKAPTGGSLYYTEDLENVAGSASGSARPGITLEDKRFCVGPDTKHVEMPWISLDHRSWTKPNLGRAKDPHCVGCKPTPASSHRALGSKNYTACMQAASSGNDRDRLATNTGETSHGGTAE
ncbi:hypothetical protein PAXINDRAFT_178571 [Paxillus involutus ATCC 200175]|nr:hypothetical protein PAXINDRAFT_178571 [Paxillus involutus ATCC 200175]